MNLLLSLESLKIYKVKHERWVQVGFILLYLINVLPFILPAGDTDFTAFMRGVENLMVEPDGPVPMLTQGNLIVIGLMAATSLVNLFVTLIYASLMVGEASGLSGREIGSNMVAGLPRVILLLLLLAVPALLSSFLLFIPLILAIACLYLTPVFLLADRKPLSAALQFSLVQTKGRRVQIIIQIFMLSVLLSVPESIVLMIVPDSMISSVLIPQFFIVLKSFAQGRLLGLFFINLVKKVTVVIPSKPPL